MYDDDFSTGTRGAGCQRIDSASCLAPASRMTRTNLEKGPVVDIWKPLGSSSSVVAMGLSWFLVWLALLQFG